MAELLVEILQEEIPSRMQQAAAVQLGEKLGQYLGEQGLSHGDIRTFATPLRLVAVVNQVPVQQPDQTVEKKGPLLNSPSKAIEGFLHSVGVTSIEDCNRVDTPKGEALLYRKTSSGQETRTLLPAMIAKILQQFYWPKSMRMADSHFRWVRPLRQVLVLFDQAFVTGKIPLDKANYMFEKQTIGKNFSHDCIAGFSCFSAYQQQLAKRGIVLDAAERKQNIVTQLTQFAAQNNVYWWDDQALLNEVSGLSENVCLRYSQIEQRFMALPEAVLRLTIRSNQKYFLFRQQDNDAIAPYFAFVTHNDDPAAADTIIAGNVRVLRARLRDAEFFLSQDQRQPLAEMSQKLGALRFAEGLGSMADKCQRMSCLLRSPALGVAVKIANTLPLLAKADLMSEMIGEFAELQGIMGAYYATQEGLDASWGEAIAEHYSPKGPSDSIPASDLGQCLAIADKLDTIAGFAAKGALPKGSGDPFAIRRAMLGVIRILLARDALAQLPTLFATALEPFSDDPTILQQLWGFYQGRMVQYLRDEGIDTAVAWAAMDGQPARVYAVAKAMQVFIARPEGQRLRQAYLRAYGILRQYSGELPEKPVLPAQGEPADSALLSCLHEVEQRLKALEIKPLLDFIETFAVLEQLVQPIDQFFDSVMINSDCADLARFRHSLLQYFLTMMNRVANFERLISG